MFNPKVRGMSAMLSAVLLSLSVTACGGGGKAEAPANKPDNQSAATAPKEPVELVFYNASNSGATLESFLASEEGKRIQEKFPQVKIKFVATGKGTTPREVLASGEKIDLIINSVFAYPALMEAELVADISDLIQKHKYDVGRLEPTTIDFQRQLSGGGLYGLPLSHSIVALFYNKDLFDKFGVPYPKDGMMWDEVYDLAKKLTRTESGTSYYGFASNYSLMYNVNQLSVSYIDPKTNKPAITDDKFVSFINNFARFAQISGNEKATTDSFIKEKNTAMMASTSGNWGFDHWDAVSMPSYSEAKGIGPQVYATYMNIASTSKNRDIAFEILADLTSDEFQLKRSKAGFLPIVTNPDIVKAFDQDAGKYKGKNVSAFFPEKRAAPTNKTKYDGIFESKTTAAYKEIAAGTKDVVTALREALDAAQKEMGALK